MALDPIGEHSAELFVKCFGREPRWLVAAPGRVNLIGEHTDYNDGFVLPMAIERYTVIAADRHPGANVTVHSETTGETAEFGVRSPVTRGDPPWSNYVRGVVAGFQWRGIKVPGFDAVIESSLPYGGGLASSAALEVATATALEAMCGTKLDPLEKALLCQRAEHEFAGVPCGLMDQFTSILGKKDEALLLDCRSRQTTPVKMKDPGVTVLVINTNVRHRLAEGEYARRRQQCEAAARALNVMTLREATMAGLNSARKGMDPVVFRRARHVITENERTLLAARAIQAGDWPTMGKLMYDSHASLRDDYEVSCRELDIVVEIAGKLGPKQGVIGCRMTGAGFGGCAVSLVKTDAVRVLTRTMAEMYEKETESEPAMFWSRPAAGARLLK
jgi:galactokinase